ncbi:MAG: transcriptional regulator [Clostridia bacterium]|nr:transcriptional regulator [Clostridia bacterium]
MRRDDIFLNYRAEAVKKNLSTIERIILILNKIKHQEGNTAQQLAQLCNTSVRTIYRDIKQLDELGVHITSQGKQGYYLVESCINIPPSLNIDEYIALCLAPVLSGQSKLKRSPFLGAFNTAKEKIITQLKIKGDLANLGEFLGQRIRIHQSQMDETEQDNMKKIVEAMIRYLTIKCTYYSMYRDEESERMMDPYYLIPRGGHLYLLAFCHTRHELRFFRLNRFKAVALANKHFFIEDDLDIDAYLATLWGVQDEMEEVTFKVCFSQEVARYIKEEQYYTKCDITDNEDGSIDFTAAVRSGNEFLRWLRQFGKEAEILAPEEYRQKMLDEAEEMRRMYKKI